ncbi:lytic murein transglycosylase [Patescibacteria group bacterium]|nr:lytic murein transglycosylase [Patescibacteria group bacterium]MBU4023246.1 lytic murein transglycosylase [Patescibacteria group bacterium]MBU4078515.1 lytic murein transglycosylase [Patescibacteria group bacterium]
MEGNFKRAKFALAISLLIFLCFSLFYAKSFNGVFVFAQEDLTAKCQKYLNENGDVCAGMSEEKCQKELNECLEFYEQQSDYYEGKVSEKQTEKKTLENKVFVLKNKINKINSDIYTSNLMIKDLNIQIGDTQESIGVTSDKIEQSTKRLSELLRLIEEQDRRSLLEVMLSEEELSDFFDELAALEALSLRNQELLIDIKALKGHLESEEQNLSEEKQDFEYAVVAYEIQKDRSQQLKSEEELLLKKTKGQEELYQQYLKETEAKAIEIRKSIFQLAQVSEDDAPTQEEAYKLAKYVEGITGVRAALILGLIQVESAMGKNVGQCNCSGRSYCTYPDIGWDQVMNPNQPYQRTAFKQIVEELGLDINATPISCSVSGGKVQWGGAMGPAQFMPATWLSYKSKITAITGEPANPWRVRDAFLAAGLYLKAFNADTQILQKEIGAVTAYLCGTTYMTTRCEQGGGYWYRSLVIKNASQWEDWIDQGVFNGN